MHSLAARLQTAVTDFIAQREALWLLISAEVGDAPIVFKLLLDSERKCRSEVFLLFGASFINAEQYADEIVALFLAEYRALAAGRAAQHCAPLGDLPDSLLAGPGQHCGPAQRLAAVVHTAQRLLPSKGRHRLVCAFWPLQVADPVAYGQLLEALIPLDFDPARSRPTRPQWTQDVRLIGREVKQDAQTPRCAWSGQPVARAAGDFSPAALGRSLQQTIDDAQKPEAVRMHALFMQAAIELAQSPGQSPGSAAAAIAKFGQVLAYYQKQRNPNMQTLVLIQLGEFYQKRHQLPEAWACYEQALAPAAAAPVPGCVALLAKNLGEVAFLQQRYADAATGYKTWHRIAGQLGDDAGVAAALTKLALVQEASR